MARIESKVRDLVADDPEMHGAVETVLARSEDGEVKWVDVREDLTSGQWGRLIEKGVLVDGESGFRVADVEATRTALNGEGESVAAGSTSAASTASSDEDDESWSTWDKLAGLVTVGFFAAYTVQWLQDLVGNAMNVLLGPLITTLPFYAVVIVLAVGTGLYSTLLRALLMDMDKLAEYQEAMKDMQERQKQARKSGDDDALKQIQQEQMESMGNPLNMMKLQFRPMVWIMFLTIPVFLWMYWGLGIGSGQEVSVFDLKNLTLPFWGTVGWKDQIFLGVMQTWIVWYFLCSLAFTQIVQKALNIEMTPSTS